MSWDAAKFFLELIALLGAFLAWWYAWQSSRSKASQEDINALRSDHDTRLTAHGERITRLEGKAESQPGRGDIEKLHGRIGDLSKWISDITADVAEVGARLDGVKDLVGRLEKVTDRQEKYLLGEGRSK